MTKNANSKVKGELYLTFNMKQTYNDNNLLYKSSHCLLGSSGLGFSCTFLKKKKKKYIAQIRGITIGIRRRAFWTEQLQ